MLDKFGMADANPVPVPSPAGFVFTKNDSPQADEKAKLEDCAPAQRLINFLSCWTRPDVTFCVNKLSKFMSNPGTMHWAGLNHLIKYFKGTAEKGLLYDFGSQQGDARLPRRLLRRLPGFFAGYAFFYGGAPISWESKLHSFVTFYKPLGICCTCSWGEGGEMVGRII